METDSLVEIKWFKNNDVEKKISSIHLRKLVFVDEQKFALELEQDDKDSADNLETMNLLIFHNKTPVGTSRLIFNDSNWLISRLCILKDYRGKKLGNFIMEETFKKCEEFKIEFLQLCSEVYAKDFYRKHGFIEFGDTYYDEHMEIIMMSKKLK